MKHFKKQIGYNVTFCRVTLDEITTIVFNKNQTVSIEFEEFFKFNWGEPSTKEEFDNAYAEAVKQINNKFNNQ